MCQCSWAASGCTKPVPFCEEFRYLRSKRPARFNRLQVIADPACKAITYSYDARGQRATMAAPTWGTFSYSQDASGRMIFVEDPDGERVSFTYDANNRETLSLYPDGMRVSQPYDAANRIVALFNFNQGGTVGTGFSYKFDEVGNRLSVVEASGDTVTWSYDSTYQLTREQRTGSGNNHLGLLDFTLDQWEAMSLALLQGLILAVA